MRRFVDMFLKEEDLLQLYDLLAPLLPVTNRITLHTFPMMVAVLVDMEDTIVMRTDAKITMYNFKRTAKMLLFFLGMHSQNAYSHCDLQDSCSWQTQAAPCLGL